LRQQEEEEAAERERRKQERSEFKDLLMRVKAANKQGSTVRTQFLENSDCLVTVNYLLYSHQLVSVNNHNTMGLII